MVVFGQSGFIRVNLVVFGQKLFFSGKSGCIRARVVVFGQKLLYLGKVLLFGQKWL